MDTLLDTSVTTTSTSKAFTYNPTNYSQLIFIAFYDNGYVDDCVIIPSKLWNTTNIFNKIRLNWDSNNWIKVDKTDTTHVNVYSSALDLTRTLVVLGIK